MVLSHPLVNLLLLLLLVWPIEHASSASPNSRLLLSHPTKVTGFGSSRVKKSIFASTAAEGLPTNLSISKYGNNLWFRSHNETLCIVAGGADNGDWKVEPHHVDENQADWKPAEGIYGVFELPSGVVWAVITSSVQVIVSEPWGQIRRVKQMELIHVASPNKRALSPQQAKEELRQLRLLRAALKTHGFFFTLGGELDITQTLQRGLGPNRTETPDSRFFWNEPAIQSMLRRSPMLSEHIIPVSSAYAGIQRNISVSEGSTYDQILISRRSRYRAGTRFTKRGADSSGGCANYAETEQICLLGNKTILAHVQTRGSIPLRWSSPTDIKTYRPKVRIGTDPVAQAKAVQSHVFREWGLYVRYLSKLPKLVFVNLIDKKKDQGRLGCAFDAVLKAVLEIHKNTPVNPTTVEHIWYDFHAEVKHGRWEKLAVLLDKVAPTLKDQGYFKAVKNAKTGKWDVSKQQNGVVRTNCMDCLDRTNVVQSIFGRYMLFQSLASLGKKKAKKLPTELSAAYRKNSLTLPWLEGEIGHRLLWADNADTISRLYAGTPALKGDFTRTGKRTKQGALEDGMNSLQRYYLNNFLDADRQEGMDLLVGHADFSLLLADDEGDGNGSSAEAHRQPSSYRRSDMSLANAMRAVVDDATDGAETDMDESRYLPISMVGGGSSSSSSFGGLDLRWLPGDLQSHLRASASIPEQSSTDLLKQMDKRAASDIPWWAIPDSEGGEDSTTATATGDSDFDSDHQHHIPINAGHVIAGLIAGIQAPITTAVAAVGALGLAILRGTGSD